jgi:hypothetical protein
MLRNLLLSQLVITSLFLSTGFFNAQAQDFQNKQIDYTDIKCHVLLATGKPMISLWRIDKNQVTSIKQWIVGKKFTPPNSIKPVAIYEVFDCIAGDAKFIDARARRLDENTAR